MIWRVERPAGSTRTVLRGLHARKTAKAPELMAEAWVRAPSIGRTGMPRPVCGAVRSATADSPRLGSGSATKTPVHACIGRLSVVAGTARARWLRQLAAVCWAEEPPATATEAERALGPMLPASARERWPFCVVRDSCHAALPDQPGVPPIGSDAGLAALAAAHEPSDLRLLDILWMQRVLGHAAWVCLCQIASQCLKPAFPCISRNWERSRAVRVKLCACRRRAERPGRPRSCRQVRLTRDRRLVRVCAKRGSVI